jgi:hypothetical protein
MRSPGVLGAFHDPGRAAAAARALRRGGFEVRAAMPAPFADVLEAIGRPPGAIDLAALTGALAGIAGGALLTAATSLAWPMVTGGKPIVSVPPFAIVAFELGILAAALAAIAALAAGAWRGRAAGSFPDRALDPDRIDLLATGADVAGAERILRAGGAVEVRRVP